jgi:hypothetical protein
MQTVALGFAFSGQSQLLSNPMLGIGPNGGLPMPVQITKPQTMAIMIQKAARLLVTSCSLLILDSGAQL